jgi:hypothetical protein
MASGAATAAASPAASSAAAGGCSLGPNGQIQHVFYIQFDNTHFLRDNPNVPSDIEQIPALKNFMEQNGTVLQNDHTPLIAHTADDLLTSLTGTYGDQQGIPEANEYLYYQPNGTTDEAGSFSYWTDPVDSYTTANGRGTDSNFNILDSSGRNAPAPWVPFTRAGCNVGEVALADLDLENALPDAAVVFGRHSREAADAANPNYPFQTEYQGLSVHCAKGAAFCADNRRPVADRLPDEPGGYTGYQAVFGAKYLDPALNGGAAVTNLNGSVITDGSGHPGFPGYDSMQPNNALAYTLDMQKAGIPVTYTYLTDAHDNASTGNGMGPGEPAYEQQLKQYNQSFGTFFADLRNIGITPANSLFVFGEDENDHYAGSPPLNPGCTGTPTPCHYDSNKMGEVQANLQDLLSTEQGVTTPFTIHDDSAPFVYLTGQPTRTATAVRTFGRALTKLTATDPYQNATVPLTNYVADPVELKVLHMITADPARTPTFSMFANPDFYLCTEADSWCPSGQSESFGTDVWNHGDIAPDINQSWMAFVGAGVSNLGVSNVWASETDTRATMMALLGLHDDYTHEGRVLTEILNPAALPASLARPDYTKLAEAYTSIESPVGPFGLDTLSLSTNAIASSSPNDHAYSNDEATISELGNRRDAIGQKMIALLEAAAFSGQPIPHGQATVLERQAAALLQQAGHEAS